MADSSAGRRKWFDHREMTGPWKALYGGPFGPEPSDGPQ
jgi:hypothetical protein